MGTLGTELRSGRQLATAVRASPRERGRALFAELRPGAILVLAPGTLHLTLASQVGGGRGGGTNLAPGPNHGQQGPKPLRTRFFSRLRRAAYGRRSGSQLRRLSSTRPAIQSVSLRYLGAAPKREGPSRQRRA